MAAIVLPEWNDCVPAVAAGEATALQRFIHDNEPAGGAPGAAFRAGLLAVLDEAAGHNCVNCRHWSTDDDGDGLGCCALLLNTPGHGGWRTKPDHTCQDWKACANAQ